MQFDREHLRTLQKRDATSKDVKCKRLSPETMYVHCIHGI